MDEELFWPFKIRFFRRFFFTDFPKNKNFEFFFKNRSNRKYHVTLKIPFWTILAHIRRLLIGRGDPPIRSKIRGIFVATYSSPFM